MGGDGCTWELAPVGWPFPAGDVENPAPAADVTAVAWHAGGIFNWVEEVEGCQNREMQMIPSFC